MDKNKKRFTIFCILAAAIITAFIIFYYGAAIKPGLDERDNKVLDVEPEPEPEPETWTPDLREEYANSQPIEYLEYNPPMTFTINNKSKETDQFVVVIIPESMESKASFVNHTHIRSWEDGDILVGNKTKTVTYEIETAYIFTHVDVYDSLSERYTSFLHLPRNTFIVRFKVIDLTSATFHNVEVE